jgi:GMP synthase (glutamine-hydrolysing)
MTSPKMIIVKTGQAVAAARADGKDFEHWFMRELGPESFDYQTIQVDNDQPLPPVEDIDPATVVLITGSPAMVSHRLPWSERTAAWLAAAHRGGHAMLGVCFGHQLLAHALGGTVGPNPVGRRMGLTEVTIIDRADPLLGGFTERSNFHVSHVEVVLALPDEARIIATAAHDPHHALHFGGRSWGIQFHPEFDRRAMRAYIETRSDALRDEGQDPAALIEALAGESAGPSVLRRFAELACAATTSDQQCSG